MLTLNLGHDHPAAEDPNVLLLVPRVDGEQPSELPGGLGELTEDGHTGVTLSRAQMYSSQFSDKPSHTGMYSSRLNID